MIQEMREIFQRLAPETLTAIASDLHKQRFLSRDRACSALDTIEMCLHYGAPLKGKFVVFPSPDTKPGWYVLSTEEAAEWAQPAQPPSEEEQGGQNELDLEPTAKQESQAPDSADRDDPLI